MTETLCAICGRPDEPYHHIGIDTETMRSVHRDCLLAEIAELDESEGR